ncbi:MAG: hypothetical protein IJ642_11425 [Oscillospiraceae bacterium]|nr:hypothetical protein [Oscillospiraceae bacterium]
MNADFALSEIKRLFTEHDYAEEIFLSLEWQKTECCSEVWNLNYPHGLEFLLITFPESETQKNFISAVLQCFIMKTALDEEWKEENYLFSERSEKISLLKRWQKHHSDFLNFCLDLPEKRFRMTDSNEVFTDIANYGNAAETIQDSEIIRKDSAMLNTLLSGAFCTELGGCYALDHEYLCIRNNQILLLSFGIWD